jgi:hypothetical protein
MRRPQTPSIATFFRRLLRTAVHGSTSSPWARTALAITIVALLVYVLGAAPEGLAIPDSAVLDQSDIHGPYSVDYGWGWPSGPNPPGTTVAQIFRAGVTGALTDVALPILGCLEVPPSFATCGQNNGSVVATLVAIAADGTPDSTHILATATIAGTDIPLTTPARNAPLSDFSFANPPTVTAGSAYAITVTAVNTTGVMLYLWGGFASDSYSPGASLVNEGSGWITTRTADPNSPFDLGFQTWVVSSTPPPVPPPTSIPKLGERVVVAPVSGSVRVRRPGSSKFVALTAGVSVSVGSELDTTKGTVRLTSATTTVGVTQSANFYSGRFIVTQTLDGLVDLRLSGGNFKAACSTVASARTIAVVGKKKKPKTVRKLWGNGHGRFRTSGRYASAAVRGTWWLTADRCDGTLVTVRRGRVLVTDLRTGRTVTVTAGHGYLTPATLKKPTPKPTPKPPTPPAVPPVITRIDVSYAGDAASDVTINFSDANGWLSRFWFESAPVRIGVSLPYFSSWISPDASCTAGIGTTSEGWWGFCRVPDPADTEDWKMRMRDATGLISDWVTFTIRCR